MFPWKAIGAAVVIFGAGVVSGGMGMQLYRAKMHLKAPRMPGGPPAPWFSQRMDFMRRMGDRLGLSEEQRTRIDEIVRQSQQRTRELWEPLAPKFKEEMERVRQLVDAELTPEQRGKAELYHQERFSGPPGERPQGRWREGDGSRPRSRGPDRGPEREQAPSPPPRDGDSPPSGSPPSSPPVGAGPPS